MFPIVFLFETANRTNMKLLEVLYSLNNMCRSNIVIVNCLANIQLVTRSEKKTKELIKKEHEFLKTD